MNAYDYQCLVPLFALFFHQDWMDEFDSDKDAIHAFVRDSLPEEIEAAQADLTRLIQDHLPEEQLESILLELDCNYYPPADNKTYQQWLIELEKELNHSSGSTGIRGVRRDYRTMRKMKDTS